MARGNWISGRSLAAVAVACVLFAASYARGREQQWLRADAGEITLLTDLDRRTAAERAGEFAQYVAALRAYFGEPKSPLAPLTMVVFARERDFNAVRPLGRNGKPEEVAGFFVRHESWAVAAMSANANEDARHTIFHEGVHWYLAAAEPAMPPWYEEGMAEVFATFEIEDNKAVWGRAYMPDLALLRYHGPQPIRKILYTAREDLFGKDMDPTNLFYAESWAFVHYLVFGLNTFPRDAAKTYASLVKAHTPPEASFARAFGVSFHDMDVRLSRYIEGGQYHISRRPLASIAPIAVTPASLQDIDEALGRLALVTTRVSSAADRGRAMIARDSGDPRGHALLGLALDELKQPDEALEQFKIAVKQGCRDFQPYFEVARAAAEGEARAAADNYARAIALYPEFEGSYANLGGMVGVLDPIKPEDRTLLDEGRKRFPDDMMIAIGLAQLAWRDGDRPRGRAMMAEVLKHDPPPTSQILSFAGRVRDSWDLEEFFDQINDLNAHERFAEAVQRLDDRLKTERDVSVKTQLRTLRQSVNEAALLQHLENALNSRDWVTSRSVIETIRHSDCSPRTKREVDRVERDYADVLPPAGQSDNDPR